jgi:hypothetical protein
MKLLRRGSRNEKPMVTVSLQVHFQPLLQLGVFKTGTCAFCDEFRMKTGSLENKKNSCRNVMKLHLSKA